MSLAMMTKIFCTPIVELLKEKNVENQAKSNMLKIKFVLPVEITHCPGPV